MRIQKKQSPECWSLVLLLFLYLLPGQTQTLAQRTPCGCCKEGSRFQRETFLNSSAFIFYHDKNWRSHTAHFVVSLKKSVPLSVKFSRLHPLLSSISTGTHTGTPHTLWLLWNMWSRSASKFLAPRLARHLLKAPIWELELAVLIVCSWMSLNPQSAKSSETRFVSQKTSKKASCH